MLKKWEFNQLPTQQDPSRWRLKLAVSENELDGIIAKLRGNHGKPFIIEESGYDFGIYFYSLSEDDYGLIKERLSAVCPNGVAETFQRKKPSDFLSDLVNRLETKKDEKNTLEQSKEHPKNVEQQEYISEKMLDAPIEHKRDEHPPIAYVTEEIPLNTEYTFEQFVVGPNNRFLHAAAMAVAKAPGKSYNPLFIYGGVGLGKTHLMQSIGHYVKKTSPSLRVVYISTEKFVADFIESISRGASNQLRGFYKTIDVLLVDDIQSLAQSESTQDEFFHIFNLLHQNKKQIVITCDRPPKLLTVLEDRLRSRFEWGLIADIKTPSLETRVAILKKKEEVESVDLDDNILLYIASKLHANVRELEGFLKKINAYSTLTKQEVNIDLVKTLMDELLPSEISPEITVSQQRERELKEESRSVEQSATESSAKEPEIKSPPIVAPAPEPPQKIQPAPPPVPQVKIDPTLKGIEVVFFFPSGHGKELSKVKEKFAEVIKKHKLKFQLISVYDKSYETGIKINYALFTELCKTNKVNIAVVLAPPPEAGLREDEFSNVLGAMMLDEQVSLQFVPWNELNKDYRYLNLALDITLNSVPSPKVP